MIKGTINCTCGQLFGFETAQQVVECPACKLPYTAADHADPEPTPEPEVIEDGTDI